MRTVGNEGVKRDREREREREMGGGIRQRETAANSEKIAKKEKKKQE